VKDELSPIGKAGEEVGGVVIVIGLVGLTILVPGLAGYWLLGEGPIVNILMRTGALISLVGLSGLPGVLVVTIGMGVPQSIGLNIRPSVSIAVALAASVGAVWWQGLFGFLAVLSGLSVAWRAWLWERRAKRASATHAA
jgi:hypothetical protein